MAFRTDLDLDLEERCRLLDEWAKTRCEIAALEAKASGLLIQRIAVREADVAESSFHRDAIHRSMIAEYAAAGRVSTGSIEYAFTDARTLSLSLPATRAAFEAGAISVGHVREIVRASVIVSDAISDGDVAPETMGLFEAAVLVFAERETAARTKAHARQVAATLAGATVVARHRKAAEERCVQVRSVGDGLSLLTAVLPEWVAEGILDRLTQMAREIVRTRDEREPHPAPHDDLGDRSRDLHDFSPEDPEYGAFFDGGSSTSGVIFGESGTFTTDPLAGLSDPMTDPTSPDIEHLETDTRTIDQIRADVLADLLLAATPSPENGTGLQNITARIQVTIAATTLTGADDRAAHLDGHGPLAPEIARCLAGHNTGWTRLFLDPAGLIVETDTYTPTAPMRRFLRARDQHCRFPGCRMPVHRCDIDHTHDHARGGRTRTDNLSHLCRRHHSLKHPDIDDRHRWAAHQQPDGTITWTSPLGRNYTDPPPRRVMFT
nr:HNH endonuclease signature motif containing protein [Microbacterium hydrocarbonoxydans]